jgi:hypothetical protein
MITRKEAEAIVLDRLNAAAPSTHRAAVVDAWLKPYGWIVLYDSEAYVRDGDDMKRFFGNGPTVVMHDGTVHPLGSARAAAAEVEAFERERGLLAG